MGGVALSRFDEPMNGNENNSNKGPLPVPHDDEETPEPSSPPLDGLIEVGFFPRGLQVAGPPIAVYDVQVDMDIVDEFKKHGKPRWVNWLNEILRDAINRGLDEPRLGTSPASPQLQEKRCHDSPWSVRGPDRRIASDLVNKNESDANNVPLPVPDDSVPNNHEEIPDPSSSPDDGLIEVGSLPQRIPVSGPPMAVHDVEVEVEIVDEFKKQGGPRWMDRLNEILRDAVNRGLAHPDKE